MSDTTPQTADGKVLWHFAMSLDGFVAGPDHAMDWMSGASVRPGLHDEYVTTTGAILGGRNGWDQAIDGGRPYGGAWQGPIFVLTHHPEDAKPADDVTFLNCGPAARHVMDGPRFMPRGAGSPSSASSRRPARRPPGR